MKLNTGLPSPAAVERLFSLGGKIFTSLCTRLSSKHFEIMMFLRTSKWCNYCSNCKDGCNMFNNIILLEVAIYSPSCLWIFHVIELMADNN